MACSEDLGAHVPDDWDAEGGGVAGAAAALLRALGYGNAFCSPPPARLCCEPIVLTQGALEREARLADGTERGRVPVDVLVCCEPRATRRRPAARWSATCAGAPGRAPARAGAAGWRPRTPGARRRGAETAPGAGSGVSR